MKTMLHYLNSVHVMCRLMDLGFSLRGAQRWARAWEKLVNQTLY